MQFSYSLDFIEHQRQIYSPLDFLGDVGGLADALIEIGSISISIIQLIFGNPLTKHMIQRIFEKDNSCENAFDSYNFALKLLSKRKKSRLGNIWCNSKNKLTQIKAENKIKKELDIVRFVKQQKDLKVILSLLFTRQERYLMSKNKRLTISHAVDHSTTDGTENLDPTTIEINTNRQIELIK